MGLSVEGASVDVNEDADLSGGDNGEGLGVGGARWWVCYRFPKAFGELWEDFKNNLLFSYSFSISNAMCFWSTKKGEVVNVVEMLIDKCLELWESFRFDPYSNESLLHVSEMGVETW